MSTFQSAEPSVHAPTLTVQGSAVCGEIGLLVVVDVSTGVVPVLAVLVSIAVATDWLVLVACAAVAVAPAGVPAVVDVAVEGVFAVDLLGFRMSAEAKAPPATKTIARIAIIRINPTFLFGCGAGGGVGDRLPVGYGEGE